MLDLLKPGGHTLFVGAVSNNQSTVALEQVYQHLVEDGATVVHLNDNFDRWPEANAKLWLKAREHDAAGINRFKFLDQYQRWPEPEDLAKEIKRLGLSPLVVFNDLARRTLAQRPGDHWFTLAGDLFKHLPPDTCIVSSVFCGAEMEPAPKFAEYEADRVFRVRSSGISMKIVLTPEKPPGDGIKLRGRVKWGNIVVIDEDDEL